MRIELILLVWVLFASGFYLILRRSMVKLLVGLMLLSHGVNLAVFVSGGAIRGNPPLLTEHGKLPEAPIADPTPQALILTAIVISFGLTAYAMVLLKTVYQRVKTEDLDEMRRSERDDAEPAA